MHPTRLFHSKKKDLDFQLFFFLFLLENFLRPQRTFYLFFSPLCDFVCRDRPESFFKGPKTGVEWGLFKRDSGRHFKGTDKAAFYRLTYMSHFLGGGNERTLLWTNEKYFNSKFLNWTKKKLTVKQGYFWVFAFQIDFFLETVNLESEETAQEKQKHKNRFFSFSLFSPAFAKTKQRQAYIAEQPAHGLYRTEGEPNIVKGCTVRAFKKRIPALPERRKIIVLL